ncbi:splicing factor 3B subunit 5 [Patagioenas fasciata monilis]|uniref:Splicing factor 3B subunit 5 n=1 Tax=Patagioenas fasciata monilis TaxID=372326 RepID=A0A1V4JL22_PATFA|nr:splicing factor 3B subunit 5 [Patagioenas fasciata monilis]
MTTTPVVQRGRKAPSLLVCNRCCVPTREAEKVPGAGVCVTSVPLAIWLYRLVRDSRAAAMTDRYTIHSQLEHLQSKYIGTGHADTTKWEWLVNQHRDSYCSYMGHFDLLNYFAIAENESKARVRFNLMEKMLQPCGPPADKPDES